MEDVKRNRLKEEEILNFLAKKTDIKWNLSIFDEIDSGIGGSVANAVGTRLAKLGETYQTMVVTHSPQVTSKGHYHYLVQKNSQTDKISTSIIELNKDEKLEEIANNSLVESEFIRVK